MCARLLKPERPEARPGRLSRCERKRLRIAAARLRAIAGLGAAAQPLHDAAARGDGRLNVYLYVIVPKGFFPQQDTGRLTAPSRPTRAFRSRRCSKKLDDFVEIVRQDPAVENVIGFTGGGAAQQRPHVRLAEAAGGAQDVRRPGDRAPARQARAVSRAPPCSCSRCRTSASAAAQPMRSTSSRCRRTTRRAARVGAAHPPGADASCRELADVNTDSRTRACRPR